MESQDLLVFETVARVGGISRAALELHTVQSNVTARVRLLERELGVPLFHRHSRGVRLTSAGEALLPYASRLRLLLAEARRAVEDGGVPRGALRIGSLETTAALRLPPVLAAYSRAYPAVDVTLHTGTSDSLVNDVLDYRLEGALVAGPVRHPALVETPIVEEELVVVTAPGCADLDAYLAAADEVKLIVFRTGCSYRQRFEAILAARGHTALRRLELGTLDGIVGCVAASVGITLLPRAVVEQAWRDGHVALHPLPAEQACVPTVFVRRRDAFVSSALARFVDCCRAAQSPAMPPAAPAPIHSTETGV
ncbi:MAG TPA: LysR substrate-binding domain-containing protein [Chloroflexota bacterium]|nr:LysR substrate-binding domain-containing protein [Chloroflexota bacterium]